LVEKTPCKGGEKYANEVLKCKVPGCRTSREHRVLDDGTLCTKSGNLAKHYREKHPEAHKQILMKAVVVVKSDGTNTRTVELPFEQQLKHHIDYVFAVAEDTSALRTRCRDAMMKFVQNLHPGYKLPSERRMKKILTAVTDTQLREQLLVISAVKAAAKGGPAFGLQYDLWTKRKLRDAYMSLRLTYVTEDADGTRHFHDVLLKFGHFPKLRHTAKAIAKWVLHALGSVELTPTDITLATPDGAASGLKALQMMGIYYDACVEHQFDRAVKNATGEAGKTPAGKPGGDNPDCHALIMANRKMVSKILTSTQLQEGLRRHQLQAGIRKNECLVVIKYGATRWASGHLLISRSCTLYHVINRLADEDLGADPDLLAGLQDDDLPPGIVEDRALVGDHAHVPISDDDDGSFLFSPEDSSPVAASSDGADSLSPF